MARLRTILGDIFLRVFNCTSKLLYDFSCQRKVEVRQRTPQHFTTLLPYHRWKELVFDWNYHNYILLKFSISTLRMKMHPSFSILSKIRSSYLYHATVAKTIISYQDFMRPITKPRISDIFSLKQLFISKITENFCYSSWLQQVWTLPSVNKDGATQRSGCPWSTRTAPPEERRTWSSFHSPGPRRMIYYHFQRSTGFAPWCSSALTGRRWSHPPPSQLWEAKRRSSPPEKPHVLGSLLAETIND